MYQSPFEVLTDESPSLVHDALGNNDHIGSFLYAVLAEIVAYAAKEKLDIRGIVPEVHLSGDSEIRIRLEYREVGTDYVENKILWQRNPEIAMAMLANPNVLNLASELTNVLMSWANRNSIPLSEVTVLEVMVPRGGGVIVAQLKTARDFDSEMTDRLVN